MKNYYRKGKGLGGGKLNITDLHAMMATPRTDNPARVGAPRIQVPEPVASTTAEEALRKEPWRPRPLRKKKALRMLADADKSEHILRKHRRSYNVAMQKDRRVAITKRREAKCQSQ